jgi:hypothetical protein
MTETGTGYDLSAFNLPPGPAKAQAAPQRGNGSAPPGGYDLKIFNLPPAGEASQSGARVSSAPASGFNLAVFDLPEKIELPQRTLDGKERTEKVHVRKFGSHVRARVEDAFRISPEEGVNTLHWYIGTAKGASLMDAPTIKRFEELGKGFSESKDPKVFFGTSVSPFLNSLSPTKRRKS